MSKQREALEAALSALELATTHFAKDRQEILKARQLINEALAEPEQEPDKGATIVNRKPMTEVEAMQIVSTRPHGTLVNSLHYAIRETELFHGIVR